jgi:Tol biopolymer transport system component
MAAVGAKVEATIVWSSSRFGNHDIFSMEADGGNQQRLTASEQVDWFPRFSPRGDTILFVRSKKGWVSEREANRTDKWDLFTMARDGSQVTKVADNASWGNWLDRERIIFVRGGRILIKTLASGTEEVFLHDEECEDLNGLLLQQPQLSPDGSYLGLTLRGGRRETGVWDNREKTWNATGDGCQINWWPDGQSIYWVNPSGNGGSELLRMKMAGGVPAGEHQRFMDIPGRRSHEYFPQLSDDATWMVWAASQRGHDHDIADYEIYIWQVGAPHEEATRLTFHSGNDRWPDIHLH